MARLAGALGLCTVLVAGAAPVQASPTQRRVALLPPTSEGDSDGRAAAVVQENLRAGLERGRYQVLDDTEVAAAVPEGDGCETPACRQDVARRVSAQFVVHGSVQQRDNVYRIDLQVASAQTGKVLASVEDLCEICGLAEVGEMVADRAAALATQMDDLGRARAAVAVQSDPRGADVFVDGRFVGRTPLRQELTPGEHSVRVEKAGHRAQQRLVRSIAGVQETIDLDLAAEPGGRARPGRALVIAGAATMAASVVALAGGIPLLVLDGREYRANCNPDPLGHCSQLYDTRDGGIALTVAAGALLATGAALLGVGLHRRKRAQPARATFTGSGIVVRF